MLQRPHRVPAPSVVRLAGGFLPLTLLALVICLDSAALGGDWPQILGPNRDGVAHGERLLESWPGGAPSQRWKAEVGQGYAGPVVVANRLLVFHRVGMRERLDALDAQTGKPLWNAEFPANYRGGIDPDKGPRCVPVVHEGRVYLHGADGDVHAVDLASGRTLWSRALRQEYSGSEGYFGAGSTPIVADNKLLVNAGGRRQGAGIVALSLADGQTAWQAVEEDPSYSSPILTPFGQPPAAFFLTRLTAVAIQPSNGSVRFQFPFGKRGPTVNAATPVAFDDYLFLTASYGIGAHLVRVSKGEVRQVWSNDDTLSSQFTTPVYHAGYLYGTHGREDIGQAELRCVEALTGKVVWSEPDFGVTHTLLAGDRLLLLTTSGRLVVAPATPQRFEALASTQLVRGVTRALPALAGGCLYFRTSLEEPNHVFCYQVGQARQ